MVPLPTCPIQGRTKEACHSQVNRARRPVVRQIDYMQRRCEGRMTPHPPFFSFTVPEAIFTTR